MTDIAAWLEGLGLGKYTRVFAENAIDFDILTQLGEPELKELGIVLGDRKRLLTGIAALAGSQTSDVALVTAPRTPSSPTTVAAEQRRFATRFPVRFSEILMRCMRLLHYEKRMSYLALKQEFDLDEAALEALQVELIRVKQVAVDEDGEFLVWAGASEAAALTTVPSLKPLPVRGNKPAARPAAAQALAETSADVVPLPVKTPTSDAERRPLTVMFCDLADSTTLSTRLDPEDLQDVIRAYQDTCTRIIQDYEGYVAKYMGDGILVYFGYPKSLERNAERGVRTGLAIVEAMAGLNRTLGRDKGIELAVRIGIATGIVMVGEVVGEGMAQERTVIGEAPNVAARLQSLAARNGIVIGVLTKELTGDAFVYEDLGAHELKGISGRVQTWAVLGLRDDSTREADQDRSEGAAPIPPLIGRDEEAGLLRRAWQSTKDEERGQVVTLSGEAGIGKSVLIDGLRAEVRGEGLPVITFRCSPYHTSSALYPVIEHFKRLARWQPEDAVEARLAKLEAMLEPYDQPLAETVPLLASLLSLALPEERYAPLALTPQQQKQQTQDMIIAITLEAAERQPLLELWEDLHWADPSTLELLGLLIEQAPTAALLLVLTARPEFVPPWPARSHITPITLNRLERPHSEALIARLAGLKPLPLDVIEHIVSKTDGVPLYVEELTKTILASDILRDTGERFELTGPLASLAIPETLQESLMARLDRLPQVRELAQLGAVLGREFAYEMISGLSGIGEASLQEGLGQLVESELFYQRGRPPRARYIFKHALVQDAAYDSLLRRPRQQHHLQVAQLLEARFPEIVEAQPELVAHHYSEAGSADQAVAYWLKAGQRAARTSANAEAYSNLKQGLEQLKALPEGVARDELELDLLLASINPLVANRGYSAPETKAVSERAIELCRQTGQVARSFPALYGQWVYNLYTNADCVRTKTLAADYLEAANAQQEIVPRLVGHRLMGTSSLVGGSPTAALQHFEQAWALFDPARDAASAFSYGTDFGTVILTFGSWATCLSGYPQRACQWRQDAVACARAVGHVNTLAYALFHNAVTAFLLRDRETFERYTAELQPLTDEHSLPIFQAGGLVWQGAVLGWQGRPQDGLEKVEQGIEMKTSLQFNVYQPVYLLIRVKLLRDLGRAEDALACIAEGFNVISATHEHWGDAELHRVRGELCTSLSEDSEAEAAFTTALAIAREQEAKWWELRTATSLARLWQQQDKNREARELLTPVYNWFTEGFDTADLKEAKALLDELA